MEEVVVEVKQYSLSNLLLWMVMVEVKQLSLLKLLLSMVMEEVVVTKYSPLQ